MANLVDAFNSTSNNLILLQNESKLAALAEEDNLPSDPLQIHTELTSQTSFLRKLKFQYLEQNAKDRYVKTIVSDIEDAPLVSDEDNRRLQAANADKKAQLKEAKARLAETQHNVRTLAPLVEDDYNRGKQAASSFTELSQKILDAQVQLARLRKSYPQPRMTVEAADQQLEDQINEMQRLSDELASVSERVSSLKSQVKSKTLEVEGLKARRTEVEKLRDTTLGEIRGDDNRLVSLYDWYLSAIKLHRSIVGLEGVTWKSDNELELRYENVVINLVFEDSTRRLAEARVENMQEELGDVIEAYVQMNDVRGLLAAIQARTRLRT